MPWGNPRTSTTQWRRLRRAVLERDRHTCYICHRPGANQVDHIDGDHNNDAPSNLAAIHDNPCHRRKSSAEGNAAQRALRAGRKRPPDPHPGFIR